MQSMACGCARPFVHCASNGTSASQLELVLTLAVAPRPPPLRPPLHQHHTAVLSLNAMCSLNASATPSLPQAPHRTGLSHGHGLQSGEYQTSHWQSPQQRRPSNAMPRPLYPLEAIATHTRAVRALRAAAHHAVTIVCVHAKVRVLPGADRAMARDNCPADDSRAMAIVASASQVP